MQIPAKIRWQQGVALVVFRKNNAKPSELPGMPELHQRKPVFYDPLQEFHSMLKDFHISGPDPDFLRKRSELQQFHQNLPQ